MKKILLSLVVLKITSLVAIEQEKYINLILNKVTNKTNQTIGVNIAAKPENEPYKLAVGYRPGQGNYRNENLLSASPITVIKPGDTKKIGYTFRKPISLWKDEPNGKLAEIIFLTSDQGNKLIYNIAKVQDGGIEVWDNLVIRDEKRNFVHAFPPMGKTKEELNFNSNENVNIYIDVILKSENLKESEYDLYATEGTPSRL